MSTPSAEGRPGGSDQDGAPADGSVEAGRTVDTAMRGFFGRDSVYMVLWVLQVAAAAAMTPLITRLLGLREFGGVALAMAVMQVLVVLAGCGLQVAIQRWFAHSHGEAAASGLLTLGIVVAVAVTAVAWATGSWWGPLVGARGSSRAVQLAVLWAGTTAMTAVCLALLRSQDRLRPYTVVTVLQSVVAGMSGVALLLAWRPTAEAFLLGHVATQALAAAVAMALTQPRRLRAADRALVRAGLRFGLPLVPAMLGGLLLGTADRFVVNAQLGSEAVARYQVAYNVGSLPMLVLLALDSSWLPRVFSVEDAQHREAVLATSRRALYRLLAPVMAGLSLGAPLILRLWAPPEFRPDDLVTVTAVVIVSAVPYAAALSATRGLLARSATGTVAAAAVLATVANVGLTLLLVPGHGLLGAAVATFIAYALQHGLLLAASGSLLPERTPAFSSVWPVVSGSAVALLAVLLPLDATGLVLRTTLAVACIWWFGVALVRIAPVRRLSRGQRRRRTRRGTPR